MTVHDDLATLRDTLGEWLEATGYANAAYVSEPHAALDRVEAEIVRLEGLLARPVSWREETWKMRAEAAEAEAARLRDGLAKIQKFQPNRLAWYEGLGIVFKRAPGCAPTEWEAVAFWTYTDLCEIEYIARRALAAEDTR